MYEKKKKTCLKIFPYYIIVRVVCPWKKCLPLSASAFVRKNVHGHLRTNQIYLLFVADISGRGRGH